MPEPDEETVADIEAALSPDATEIRNVLGLVPSNTLAGALGVNPDALRKWRGERRGPTYVRIGKRVWYLLDDVRDWLDHRRTLVVEESEMNGDPKDPNKPAQPGDEPSTNPNQPGGPSPDTPADNGDSKPAKDGGEQGGEAA